MLGMFKSVAIHLWCVVRVAELRGDVQTEVVRPVQLFVSEPHHLAVALLDDGLGQHRFNRRIQLL